MPKSSKKKKEKATDFKKAKLKLGKGQKAAPNATDTSFKTRSIVVPLQDIDPSRPSDEALTRKNQSFAQLLTRLRHYNALVRRESLTGMREILQQTGLEGDEILSQALEACGRLVGDEDASVRKGLIEFLRWLLNNVSTSKLAPHIPLFLLHTLSNMAHIFPELRVDSMRVLKIFLEVAPRAVISDCIRNRSTSRVLNAFRSILQVKSRGRNDMVSGSSSTIVLIPPTKAEILSCLRLFLLAVSESMPTSDLKTSLWYLRSAFDSNESFSAFRTSLSMMSSPVKHWNALGHEDWPPYMCHSSLLTSGNFNQPTLELDMGGDLEVSGEQPVELLIECVDDLIPALADLFLDASSHVTSYDAVSHVHHHAEIMWSCISGIEVVFSAVVHAFQEEDIHLFRAVHNLGGMLNKLASAFPFTRRSALEDLQIETTLRASSRCYCQLVALYQLMSTSASRPPSVHLSSVLTYVIGWLQDETVCTVEEYSSMMPVVWCLFSQETSMRQPGASFGVFEALIRHAERIPILSPVKELAFAYIGRLILLQSNRHYVGSFRGAESDVGRRWLLDIPRLLWEVGPRQLKLIENMVRFLLRSLQQQNGAVSSISTVLAKRLAPFFYVFHPIRGPMPGPCEQLPSHLQRMCLDVAALCPESADLQSAVAHFRARAHVTTLQ